MRYLTLKRRKSFVGSIATLKVYISDPEVNDLTIKGFNCRKLGELKNGQEMTFEIPNDEARVFVIAGIVSKDYCVDMKKISAGEENVCLSGACKFNLSNGNAFRFDGEADDEEKNIRTSGTKKGHGIMVISIILGVLIGIGVVFIPAYIRTYSPKDFSVGEMTITLNRSFKEYKEYDIKKFTSCLSSKSTAIYFVQEKYFDYELLEDLTVEEYAKIFIESNKLNATPKNENGILSAEYEFTNQTTGQTFTCFVAFYKTDTAFWAISFATYKEKAEQQRPNVIKWAKSVRFDASDAE